MEEEVVPHRQQDVDVGFEGQAAQELGEGALHLRRVQREQLLELVHDDQAMLVPLAPLRDQPTATLGLLEAQQRVHGARSPRAAARRQGPGQIGEGAVARRGDDRTASRRAASAAVRPAGTSSCPRPRDRSRPADAAAGASSTAPRPRAHGRRSTPHPPAGRPTGPGRAGLSRRPPRAG